MNDPGLDQPIQDSANAVQRDAPSDVQPPEGLDGVDEDEEYTEPSRWWFASTAFPLIAGTFGPMASAFNVCALAADWRVVIPPGSSEDDGTSVPDPRWLVAINAVSLVLALVANLALLLNMARRLPFSIAQPITIIGWYISSFILIGLVSATHSPSFQLPEDQNPALTQAFYYAIMAAALYFIISCLMVITVYGAYKGHYPIEFKLTMSQRTLMVQTIAFLIYVLAGGAVFAHIEDWLFLNGVYWANTTLLTIGTGDYSPTTHTGQSLIFPYAIGGIVLLGLVIGSIRSLVLERGKKKLSARMIEKKREQVVSQMNKNSGAVKVSMTQKSHNVGASKDQSELERRQEEFRVMRLIQEHAHARRKWMSLAISVTAWLVLWFIGAVVFWVAEENQQGLTYFESVYFSYISLLTIGYGDYAPVANSSKAFFVFWSLLAVPTLTIVISNMGDTVIKAIRDFTLWVGEITVLPGDDSMLEKVKDAARKTKDNKIFGADKDPIEEPAGGIFLAEEERDVERADSKEKRQNKRADGVRKNASDRLGKEYEAVELQEFEEARSRDDALSEDVHLHHYLLVREIRNVMRDIGSSPPKRYTYAEWSWFLRLLGEDEGDSQYHREAHTDVEVADINGKQFGKDISKEKTQWSWIGARSPLMGETEEPDWVLEHLSNKLEKLLRDERIRRKPEREEALRRDLQHKDNEPIRDEEKVPPAGSEESDKTLRMEQS